MGFLFKSKPPAERDPVTLSGDTIAVTLDDGCMEKLTWQDVAIIEVLTNEWGPYAEDVFLMFYSKDRRQGLAIPQFSKSFEPLLKRAQALPGFDNDQFIKAMQSTSNAVFPCWPAGSGSNQSLIGRT